MPPTSGKKSIETIEGLAAQIDDLANAKPQRGYADFEPILEKLRKKAFHPGGGLISAFAFTAREWAARIMASNDFGNMRMNGIIAPGKRELLGRISSIRHGETVEFPTSSWKEAGWRS